MKAKPLSLELPAFFRGADIEWVDELTIQCSGAKLKLVRGFDLERDDEDTVILFKGPRFIRNYLDLLDGHVIDNMVEVGIWDGGSAIFFWNLLKPEKLCCLELKKGARRLTEYIERQRLADGFRTHYGVDQGDRECVRKILAAEFGGSPLDLVVDDASHLYGPSLATFETLFPALREGGLYVLEDWKTSLSFPRHGGRDEPDDPPLHQLVHDLLDLSMRAPRVISCVRAYHDFVVFTRGPETLRSSDFTIAAFRSSGEGP
jgi:hypothetical protein